MRARLPANLLRPLPSTSVDRILASQFWGTSSRAVQRSAGSLATVVQLRRGLSPATAPASDQNPSRRS